MWFEWEWTGPRATEQRSSQAKEKATPNGPNRRRRRFLLPSRWPAVYFVKSLLNQLSQHLDRCFMATVPCWLPLSVRSPQNYSSTRPIGHQLVKHTKGQQDPIKERKRCIILWELLGRMRTRRPFINPIWRHEIRMVINSEWILIGCVAFFLPRLHRGWYVGRLHCCGSWD